MKLVKKYKSKGLYIAFFILFAVLLWFLKLTIVIAENGNYIYLSDIYESNVIKDSKYTYTEYSDIKLDTNINNGKITLKVDNEATSFDKGIGAHASSSIVYNIEEYSSKYTNLSAYVGIDNSQGSKGNGVIFKIWASNDELSSNNWTLLKETPVLKGDMESIYINVDIKDYKYLKLIANSNGSNGNDHSVYGDIRLLKEGYNINDENIAIKKVAEYDEEIKSLVDIDNIVMNEDLKNKVLLREFVNRYGYNNIQNVAKKNSSNRKALEYIINTPDVLDWFVIAGEKDGGNYVNILNAWTKLYNEYYDSDFKDYKDNKQHEMLLKMAIAISVSNASNITFWTGGGSASDPINRYEVYKYLYLNDYFYLENKWSTESFEALPMELIRYVVDNKMHDDEILWLQDYSKRRAANNIETRLDAYTYIKYTMGFNYNNEKYYTSPFETWNQGSTNYYLDDIRLVKDGKEVEERLYEYGTRNIHRLWMVFNNGAVCGGLAKTYANLRQVYGMPATVIGQPGHAATIVFEYNPNKLSQGKYEGMWYLKNDINGFQQSEKGERLPLGWGSTNWDSYYNVSYIFLSQHAFNQEDAFTSTMYLKYLASVYSLDKESQLEIYNDMLKQAPYNLDAYVGKINAYKDLNKTSSEYMTLVDDITTNLKWFPLPMYDLLNLIKTEIDSADKLSFETKLKNTLETAKNVTANDFLQPTPCKKVAEYLLNNMSNEPFATFSFDGENAGKIIINEAYTGSTIFYTLDGANIFQLDDPSEDIKNLIIPVHNQSVINLTAQQLEKLSKNGEENDIVFQVYGTKGDEDATYYTIDITKQSAPNLTVNDYENRFYGSLDNLEISLDNGVSWCDYLTDIRLDGNKEVLVRYKRTGTKLESDTVKYIFTEDANESDDIKYLPIQNNVSINGYSSQQSNTTHAATNIIDGNENTIWHNTWDGEDYKYIEFAFTNVQYVSFLEYMPRHDNSSNGRFKSGKVLGSLDGENWIEVGTFSDFANDSSIKKIDINSNEPVKYLRVEIDESYADNSNMLNKFASGLMVNFYVSNKTYEPVPEVSYNVALDKKTNQDVILTITLPAGCTTSYETTLVFTENGSKQFVFTDPNGNIKTMTYTVNNIDKTIPNATIDWSIKDGKVIATLINETEPYTVLNNNGLGYIEFTGNGRKEFLIIDEAGNQNTIVAELTNFDELVNNGTVNDDNQNNDDDNNVSIDNSIDKDTANNNDSLMVKVPNTHSSLNNYITYIIGAILLFSGLIFIFKNTKSKK